MFIFCIVDQFILVIMAKRSVDGIVKRPIAEIMENSMPNKSKDEYTKTWKAFLEFVGEDRKPTEDEYLQYFDHLHEIREYAASTLWKMYSMLNYMHQRNYNESLQLLTPKLTQLMKSYNVTYQRKVASVFTKEEIDTFLNMKELDEDPFWIMRKAVVVVYLSGGLRSA